MAKFVRNVLGTVLTGAAAWAVLIKPRTAGRPDLEGLQMYDYAHRGLHDAAAGVPENSLAAFRKAVENGYGMELDVHLTRDGKLAVIHDSNLERVCGAEGRVEDLTWEELQNFRLLGTEEKIPSLSQVLELVDGQVPLIVEVKPVQENHAVLCRRVSEDLEGYAGLFCVESFDPRAVFWFRRNRPDWIRGQLCEYYNRNGEKMNPVLDFILHHLLTNIAASPDFVAYHVKDRDAVSLKLCRKLYQVQEVSWTIRSQEEYDMVKNDGALAIFEGFIPEVK